VNGLVPGSPQEAERLLAIIDLRGQKMSWRDIGAQLGMSHEHARTVFNAAMAEHVRPSLEQAREEAAQTYERLMYELRSLAKVEEAKPSPDLTVLRQLVESMAKLQVRLDKLFGLEAPVKVDQTIQQTVAFRLVGIDTSEL